MHRSGTYPAIQRIGQTNGPRRSPAGVRMLEDLQAQYRAETGMADADVDFPAAIPDVAHIQVLNEFLDRLGKTSDNDRIKASVALVGSSEFQAAVGERVAALEHKFAVTDGDIWSRNERADRRHRLSELVVRVEVAARRCGYKLKSRPVVGTLPTRDINAQARPGPPGESDIVVFETGMFMFTEVLARIVALCLTEDSPFRAFRAPMFDRQTIIRHVARHPGILVDFADLIFSQTFLGTCQYTDKRDLPSGLERIAGPLHDATDGFILAHEYGHVILGHPGVEHPSSAAECHRREFEADEVALKIALAAEVDPKWAFASASLFFSGVMIVDTMRAIVKTGKPQIMPSKTHPTPGERLKALSKTLSVSVPPEAYQAVKRFTDTLEWVLQELSLWLQPAFEAAHRDGCPERLVVRSYTDKPAYLYGFLARAFGFDIMNFYAEYPRRGISFELFEQINAKLLPLLAARFRHRYGL